MCSNRTFVLVFRAQHWWPANFLGHTNGKLMYTVDSFRGNSNKMMYRNNIYYIGCKRK